MNLNPHRKNWFFPIEEAPAFATVTRNGTLRDVRVPHKKALIAADRCDTFSSNTMTDIASLLHADLLDHVRRSLDGDGNCWACGAAWTPSPARKKSSCCTGKT